MTDAVVIGAGPNGLVAANLLAGCAPDRAARQWARTRKSFTGATMIILGIILLVIGLITGLSVLWTIGIVLVAIGLVLWALGAVGHAVGGRRHYW